MTTRDEIDLPDDARQALASWLTRVTQRPKFDDGENGLASAFAYLLSLDEPAGTITGDDVSTGLRVAFERRRRLPVALRSDYGPDAALSAILRSAGVSERRFPWKTVIWVHTDKIYARCGYGAPEETIWCLGKGGQ